METSMIGLICRALTVSAVAIMVAVPHARAAQITVPACEPLTAWSATVNPNDTYAVAPALPLPKALADDSVVPVFGIPSLGWTADDVKAASQAMVACYKEAKKRGDKPAMDALGIANAAVAKTLSKTLAVIAK